MSSAYKCFIITAPLALLQNNWTDSCPYCFHRNLPVSTCLSRHRQSWPVKWINTKTNQCGDDVYSYPCDPNDYNKIYEQELG